MPLQIMRDMGEVKRSNELVEKYLEEGFMNKLFRVKIETRRMCMHRHSSSKISTSIGLRLKP